MTIIDVARELEEFKGKRFRTKAPGMADGWVIGLYDGELCTIHEPTGIIERFAAWLPLILADDYQEVEK